MIYNKVIKSLRQKELLRVKKTEKSLLWKNDNKKNLIKERQKMAKAVANRSLNLTGKERSLKLVLYARSVSEESIRIEPTVRYIKISSKMMKTICQSTTMHKMATSMYGRGGHISKMARKIFIEKTEECYFTAVVKLLGDEMPGQKR